MSTFSDFFDELLLEWSYRVPTGVPNPKNSYHLYLLRGILEEMDIEPGTINEIVLTMKRGTAREFLHEEKGKLIPGPDTEAGTKRFYYTDNQAELHLVTKGYAGKKGFSPATKKDVDTKKPAEEKPIEKSEEETPKSYLPEEELNYVNTFINKEVTPETNDSEKGKILGNKIVAIANGKGKDVKFNDYELKQLSQMAISANPVSGNIYFKDTPKIKRRLATGSVVRSNDLKNSIITGWDTVKKYFEENDIQNSLPKFKSLGSWIDTPPKLGHKPFTFKPQNLLSDIKENSAENSFSDRTKKSLQEQGIEPKSLNFYGDKLDVKNPSTFISALKTSSNSILKNITTASEETQKYVNTMFSKVNNILDNNKLSDNEKMKTLNDDLSNLFLEAFDSATGLSEEESRSFLKDFGEVIAYYDLLSTGREVYMPTSSKFPLADLIEIKRDSTGRVIHIEKISVKSRNGTSAEGAASSAAKISELLATVNPKQEKLFKSVSALHVSNVENVNTDQLDDTDKNAIEKIKNIKNAKSIDSANKILKSIGLPDKEIQRVADKFNTHYEKYVAPAGVPRDFQHSAEVYKEIAHRVYSEYRTIKVMKDTDISVPLDYVSIIVNDKDNRVKLIDYGKFKSSQFQIFDKGNLATPLIKKEPPPPHVVKSGYTKNNLALRPIHD